MTYSRPSSSDTVSGNCMGAVRGSVCGATMRFIQPKNVADGSRHDAGLYCHCQLLCGGRFSNVAMT